MRLFNLLLLLLIAGSLTAQKARVNKRWLSEQDTARQAELAQEGSPIGAALGRGVSLHMMPLSFVNTFSRFRIGAQFKRDRWSYLLDLEVGSDFTQAWISSRDGRDYHFYGIRPELRFDLDDYQSGFYVGLELPFSVLSRTITGRFNTTNGTLPLITEARQERWRVSAIAKLGVQLLAGDHLLFDFYAGMGSAYREVSYTNGGRVVVPAENLEEELGFFVNPLLEGSRWVPEIALGFRIGWWF